MITMYVCPDCHQVHDEPASAAYELHVRCIACDVLDERARTIRATIGADERTGRLALRAPAKAA